MPKRHMASVLLLLALATSLPVRAAVPPAIEAGHGMVVTSQRLASEVGLEILKRGGNAVDAAVAVGYAEAVTNPCCGNIGGGGFMVLHMAGKPGVSTAIDRFINFRESAPGAATADMYLDASGKVVRGESLHGWKAVAVPGTVLGLDTALREYGTLPRRIVMEPAIRLAREGFLLTRADVDILDAGADRFRNDPAVARIFLRPDGSPWQPGDRLVQTDLANTLQAIADHGPDAFYKGDIPRAVEDASRPGGGILTAEDFGGYHVTQSEPLRCTYRGYTILSAPPPSSGGVTMCEILNVLEGYDMRALGFHSAAAVHVMVEAMRHAYLDRNTYLGDPAFIKNPLERLLSKDYAAAIRSTILPDKATASTELAPGTPPHLPLSNGGGGGSGREKPETTHYSILDKDGNAVSVTYTLNGLFGAVVMAPGTGVLMNDEMDDFTAKPGVPNLYGLVQGAANAIAPGKRPLSSMAPTIVLKDAKPFLVLGSPGGSRIITITLETLINVVDYAMAPKEAVDAPRIHHQWLPDVVYAEPFALSPDTSRLLEAMGYVIKVQTPWGAAELIQSGPLPTSEGVASSGNDAALSGSVRPGLIYGANDDRRPAGAAIGY